MIAATLPGCAASLPRRSATSMAPSVAALDHHDAQPGQYRAGRVGAVRGLRDQADVPFLLAAVAVVGPDGEQPGQLALGAGVRLQRHRRVPGDLGQPGAEFGDQPGVAAGLVRRGERVQVRELRPGDGLHLRRRVQLHRAGPQRDHRPVQCQVEVGQPPQVAQQRGLAAVLVEHRVAEETGGAPQRGREHVARLRQAHTGGHPSGQRGHHVAAGARSVVVSSQAACTVSGPAR